MPEIEKQRWAERWQYLSNQITEKKNKIKLWIPELLKIKNIKIIIKMNIYCMHVYLHVSDAHSNVASAPGASQTSA